MKVRVIFNEKDIISVDIPEGAAALDYEKYDMIITDHLSIIEKFYNMGFDVSKISQCVLDNGGEIERGEWMPKINIDEINQ